MDDSGNFETAYFADEPIEQKVERNAEQAKVQGGRALLLELIERWKDKVIFYDSLDSIPKDVRSDPDKFMLAVNANDLTKANLQVELDYLEALKDQYIK